MGRPQNAYQTWEFEAACSFCPFGPFETLSFLEEIVSIDDRRCGRPCQWAGRSTDIRIECSAVYTLRCLYMAQITSRDSKRFVSHGFCHCARPSLRFSGTRRFVMCFGKRRPHDPPAATLLCSGRFIPVSTAARCLRPVGPTGRWHDWPTLLPLVEFAINDSASPLGTGYTPFYADRGQHPRRPLIPSAAPDPAGSGVTTSMEVRALVHRVGRVAESPESRVAQNAESRRVASRTK